METMGPMNPEGADFINGIGRLSVQQTRDQCKISFLLAEALYHFAKDSMRYAFAALLN